MTKRINVSTVVQAIEDGFKGLVAEKPYRSVTVKEICERAFVSRRTFYAHYIDKRAVMASLFRRDAIDPLSRSLELLKRNEALQLAPIIIARLYEGVLGQRDYYTSLVKPMAGLDPSFELMAARAVYGLIVKALPEYISGIDEKRLGQHAYYHASAQAIFLEKWICDGFVLAPDYLGELVAKTMLASFKDLAGVRAL